MPDFWMRGLRIGPVHLTIVRNVSLARLCQRRIGWFLVWDHRWLCGTIRLGWLCLNLDVDAR